MQLHIDTAGKTAIYKQLVSQIEKGIVDGSIPRGALLPSMNDLAYELAISKETVKKAYGILVQRQLVIPRQGKGFYVTDQASGSRGRVLVIFDKFSVYKQALINAFTRDLEDTADITILNHNQSLDLLEYYLDCYLDSFDYYVITPHFPLDPASQARAVKLLRRVPFRKLILLDHLQGWMTGNFGAVYQDFENDIYTGLRQGLEKLKEIHKLRVITMPASLYGPYIRRGVEHFCADFDILVEFLDSAPADIRNGDAFLVLNSQLDSGLVSLVHAIHQSGLEIGRGVFIISYNEYDMDELILGGLTTVSTDFQEMGRLAAGMILSRQLSKVHCPFRLTRRSTF